MKKTKTLSRNSFLPDSHPGLETYLPTEGLTRFRFLTENIPAIVFEYVFHSDGSHGFKYLSPAVKKILGLTVDQYADYGAYLHPRDRLIVAQKNELSCKTNAPFNFEGPLFIPGRDTIWHSVHSSFSYLSDDGSKVFTGVIVDITEQKKAEAKLRESDERFRLLVSSVKDYAIFIIDRNGIVTSWNDGAERIKGYSADEIIGKHISNFYTAADICKGVPENNLARAREKGRFEDEGWRLRKDGTVFWANTTITALNNASGELYGYVKVTRDCTERKKTEAALRESEIRFRDLTQNVPGVIYQWYENFDGSFGFNYVSPKIRDYFNIEPSDAWKVIKMLHPEDRDRWRDSIQLANQTGLPWEFEGRLLYPDGSIKWWRGTSLMSFTNESGRIYNGIMVDITQIMETREKLTKSNERYDIVARACSDAIWDWDLIEKKVYRGEGFSELFGYTSPVISSDSIMQGIHPDDLKRVETDFQNAIEMLKDRWQAEYRFQCADGSYKVVVNNACVIRDGQNRLTRIIGAISDISEQRRLEQKLADEEKQNKREMIRAIIDAQERERMEISYELHDNINQTLATCKLLLEMASKNSDMSGHYIEKCNVNIQQVISDIRNISGNLAPYALNDLGLIAAIKDVIEKINESDKLTVTFLATRIKEEFIPDDIKMTVFRIIQEQLNNILKHAHASLCTIDLSFNGSLLRLEMIDDGHGFEKDTIKRGSGLHNIRNRAEYHKGTVAITTAPGEGCALLVELPC